MIVTMRNPIGRLLKAPCCIALFLAALHSACRAPTVLAQPEVMEFQSVLSCSPESAVAIELDIDDDATLRGILVPPPIGGPLVLHLLESGGSVAKGIGGRARTLRQLADIGVGSLMLDWTGVGLSSGTASNQHILRDGRAMWQEALQHVEGDESRVILRSASIGTLAAADLLQHGMHPRAVVLIAPIRAETTARNFAMHRFGRFFGGLLTFAMRPIVDVDIMRAIRSTEVPVLLLQPADGDLFVSAAESDEFVKSCKVGQDGIASIEGGHVQVTLLARSLFPRELAFLSSSLPQNITPDPRVEIIRNGELANAIPPQLPIDEALLRLERVAPLLRTASPELLLAAALSATHPWNAARRVWLLQAPDGSLPRAYESLDAGELIQALSLEDPAGELPIDLFGDLRAPYQALVELGAVIMKFSPDHLAYQSQTIGTGPARLIWSSSVNLRWLGKQEFNFDHSDAWQQLVDRGLEPTDATRQLLRILLITYGHVHRLRTDDRGSPLIEVRVEGEWVTLNQHPNIDSGPPSGPTVSGSLLPL